MKQNYWCNDKMMLCMLLYGMFQMLMMISADFGNETDRLALLDLKSRTENDPFNKITSSWNDSTHFCDWVGVTCNTTNGRVQILNLEGWNLIGSLPPSLGNLTFLTEIRLGHNNFHDRIPQEFGRLLRFRHLNLTHNNFGREIPANISHCTQLVVLELSHNKLSGRIPRRFFTLTKLKQFLCGHNNLTGTIPSWIGNFSSMLDLGFSENKFQGNIPSQLGRLSRLQHLTFYANFLEGTVPPSIFNITSLIDLSFTQNSLEGVLPPTIGFTLPNLEFFVGAINQFSGPVPTSLVNISGLQVLDFSNNNLVGMLPDDWGSLTDLERLNFEGNRLGSGKAGDLKLISSLANCTSLRVLGLDRNDLGGALPASIANLSSQLRMLAFGRNMLSGSIPEGIGNLINLQALGMEYNYMDGKVPPNIGKLQNLATLYLNNNQLTGPIPSSIGNLSSLSRLYIDHNRLEGSIPPSLGQCRRLQDIDLSHNSLTGSIPKEVLGLSSLSVSLTLNNNSLTGPLPSEVGQLVSLTRLDISKNKLSGNISNNLRKCISMVHLRLDGNRFEGIIPQSLDALKGLEHLDLSRNNLSGPIPEFLGKLLSLNYLNLSYNNFEGKVPMEGVFSNSAKVFITGNNNLCGGVKEFHLPPCMPNRTRSSSYKFRALNVLIPIVSTITFIIILLSIIFVCFMLKKSRKNASPSSSSKNLLQQISYLELCKSTHGFSMENLIGSGSFGNVYKGILLHDGSIVAIKVLNLQQQGASKSFLDECRALASIRHRNLLKIITSCSSIDVQGNEFKALVFDFMSNGNLDCWLHPINNGPNQRRLSFIQRLNIAIDIASGLDYLHNHCETPIVHCDLKPSNVLLNDDMVALVGDFGLAIFISEGSTPSSFSQTMSLALKGSIGYVPPEYGTGGRISIEGDIFSYGILLLEIIIGKRPTDDTFGNGVGIHLFTAMALSQGTCALDIVDNSLLYEETHQEEENEDIIQEIEIMGEEDRTKVMPRWMEECLVSLMRIGLSCSSTAPSERTSMNVVVNELQAIRSTYVSSL